VHEPVAEEHGAVSSAPFLRKLELGGIEVGDLFRPISLHHDLPYGGKSDLLPTEEAPRGEVEVVAPWINKAHLGRAAVLWVHAMLQVRDALEDLVDAIDDEPVVVDAGHLVRLAAVGAMRAVESRLTLADLEQRQIKCPVNDHERTARR